VLLALFLAAVGAELAGVEKIVGAFLAGLAVNGVLPDGRVKEQVVVVGASLFIPLFFIDLGLLLDVPVFLSTMTGSAFAVALILSLIASKGLASWWSGLLYRYDGPQMLTLWSLSLPQVAATLAATYVGFRQGLLDERMLNSVLALMVVTATLGPILTTVAMTRMASRRARDLSLQESGQLALVRRALRVLVPISNARSEELQLALAARLIDGEAGRQGAVLPLSVVSPRRAEAGRGPHQVVHRALAEGRQLLERADAFTAAAGVPSRSLLRVDNDIPGGIARTALEQGADLVLVGVGAGPRLGRWLFGDLVAAICRQAHCPVVMAKLREDPATFRRLLVPVKDLSSGALEQFQLAERLLASCPAGEGAAITLLHVHEPWLPQSERDRLARQLQGWIPPASGDARRVTVSVELQADPNVSEVIERSSESHDLVILRSLRRLVEGLPIPASDQATGLLRRLSCSVLVISDPLH
jgi:nucleotide-binding universal stress UspA family protein